MRTLLLVLACAGAAGACEPDDCLAARQVKRASPSGRRVVTVYRGECMHVVTGPQVVVEFHTPFATGGGGVFAVRDTAARVDVRWVSDDTLEVIYPAGVTIDQRETLLRFRQERVHVVYLERSGS